MKKSKIILCTLFIIGVVAIGYAVYESQQCARLNCISFKNSERYSIKEVYEDNQYIYRALFKNNDNLLRAEIRSNSSDSEAENAIKVQETRISGLFEDAAAPYPGEISNVISCSDEFKPTHKTIKQNGIKVDLFSGFVNDRLVFGSCVSGEAKYHDALTMFYCSKQKKFYQIEIITPTNNYSKNPGFFDEPLYSITCK